jgi:hypothetical protein
MKRLCYKDFSISEVTHSVWQKANPDVEINLTIETYIVIQLLK